METGERVALPRFSIGVGDRFAQEAEAQIEACVAAAELGAEVIPVWNKSNREHNIIGSEPTSTRAAADAAVKAVGWTKPYFVDADHINLATVERFIPSCDFFTLDVADKIGEPAEAVDVDAFLNRHRELVGEVNLPLTGKLLKTDEPLVRAVLEKFLTAVQDAGRIYRHLLDGKGESRFVTEISMDETDSPQTPVELLIILAAIADERIPVQTIAPKFTGRFNKGVDYVGDVSQFATEFRDDVAAIAYAVERYTLPENLKLSVHSGSDKFSIYPAIHQAMRDLGAGVHVKTAGTTWLEEVGALAESGGGGLRIAKEIYSEAYAHIDELTAPYAAVLDIDRAHLPKADTVRGWSGEQFTGALRNEMKDPLYNPSFRQLLHVSFKIAAKMGDRYLAALAMNKEVVSHNVTRNLLERHIRPVFLGS